MTQHPKGAELVAELMMAKDVYRRATRSVSFDRTHIDRAKANLFDVRDRIIALIDDPVRAAGPELLEALKGMVAPHDKRPRLAWPQPRSPVAIARAAIEKAEAPADAGETPKRTVTVGTIGHVDHGKTSLAAAITRALAERAPADAEGGDDAR